MESLGDILEKSPQEKFIEAATVIRMSPGDAEAAYMARELVHCTLPHRSPGNIPVWRRTNGNLTLAIQQGYDLKTGEPVGYPYGSIPRLVLFWMTTAAVRTKTRRLELGHSLSSFMRDVGLDPNTGGGKRSDARRLQDQARRLLEARISFLQELREEHRHGGRRLNMEVARESELWWNPRDPKQGTLWGSYAGARPLRLVDVARFPGSEARIYPVGRVDDADGRGERQSR